MLKTNALVVEEPFYTDQFWLGLLDCSTSVKTFKSSRWAFNSSDSHYLLVMAHSVTHLDMSGPIMVTCRFIFTCTSQYVLHDPYSASMHLIAIQLFLSSLFIFQQ